MDVKSNTDKVCIIGAGSSGLAAAKTFHERGIPFDCLEREHDIGGLWNEATNTGVVYDTTYLVSSRKYTGFEDYPFPEEYPTYPSHRETLAYLRAYALNFGILDKIEFNTTVERAERAQDGWRVQVAGEERPRFYRALVIANGHHHVPRIPEHSRHLHRRDLALARLSQREATRRQARRGGRLGQFRLRHRGRCDERRAEDLSQHAPRHLFRAEIHVRPADGWHHQFLREDPDAARLAQSPLHPLASADGRARTSATVCPSPSIASWTPIPTMTTVLPQLAAHGRIGVKPDIAEFAGNKVRFSDGSEVEADLVVFATGYEISIPFLDNDLVFGRRQAAPSLSQRFPPRARRSCSPWA